jgi:hypothetical protein
MEGNIMKRRMMMPWAMMSAMVFTTPAMADVQYVQGKVVQTQGHVNAACRMVQIKKASDSGIVWFRIPNTGQDNSILAITMTALAAGLQVYVAYDPLVTTGCGTEPQIQWISLLGGS